MNQSPCHGFQFTLPAAELTFRRFANLQSAGRFSLTARSPDQGSHARCGFHQPDDPNGRHFADETEGNRLQTPGGVV